MNDTDSRLTPTAPRMWDHSGDLSAIQVILSHLSVVYLGFAKTVWASRFENGGPEQSLALVFVQSAKQIQIL